MNELEDFFHSVCRAHVIAAAFSFFGMNSHADRPSTHLWNPTLPMSTSTELHWKYLVDTLSVFVDDYIMPSFVFNLEEPKSRKKDGEKADNCRLSISNYAYSFLADLLFVEEMVDAVHEGDGDRMMTVTKYLLLYFRSTGHRNYALECINIIAQVTSLLSERNAYCLKWCRFVNRTGKPGRNHSCDLEMEHWNAAFKQHIATAGGNVNASTIMRTGMALSTLQQACVCFDSAIGIVPMTSKHATKSSVKDEHIMVDALHGKYNVFNAEGSHSKFKNFPRNYFNCIDSKKFKKWIKGHIKKLSKMQNKQLKEMQNDQGQPLQLNQQNTSELLIGDLQESWGDNLEEEEYEQD